MPCFHFNVFDGVARPDREGTELPDVGAARIEALRLAGDILQDAAARGDLGEEWRIEVTDATGLTLFLMHFIVSESPATARERRDGLHRPDR